MAKYRFSNDSEPKVSKFALDRERRSTKYFRFVKTIREIDMDDIMFSDNVPRAEESTDPNHVDSLALYLQTAGYDEDAELTPLLKHPTIPGKYVVIDNHHLIDSLKKMGQKVWMGDLWEYTGSYGEAHMWAAAGDFGQEINNDQLLTKKTSRASVVAAALNKIKRVGYITQPGAPVDEVNVRIWITECKHDRIFDKGNITKIVKEILNPDKLSGKGILPFRKEDFEQKVADSNGLYGTGALSGNRYGFLVKTDNYAADGPKGYAQMISVLEKNMTPVFITYSGKDDAKAIVSNNQAYFDKMYDSYKKHMKAVETFHGIPLDAILLTKEKFFARMETVSMGQIDGEGGVADGSFPDFIERKLNV